MSGEYRGRDYARNKYSEGIVYQFADGSKIEITMSMALQADSSMTAEKFRKLKKVSDEIFKENDKSDDVYSKHVITTIEIIESNNEFSSRGIDEIIIEKEDSQVDVEEQLFKNLTDVERRRLKLYIKGYTTVKIAKMEGRSQNVVWKSINKAKKKIEKLKNNLST